MGWSEKEKVWENGQRDKEGRCLNGDKTKNSRDDPKWLKEEGLTAVIGREKFKEPVWEDFNFP